MNATAANPLHHPRYPRSSGYDPTWVFDNQMGPNVLWLTESLTEVVRPQPGMRILDLGCGTALSSIFLAKEFGAEVWATDLWIDASDNQVRIESAGVERLVVPIHAEAHTLSFAHGFFDAIVSIDAYQYFGTDDLYLGYLTGFLRAGGWIGIVSPGLLTEFGGAVPEHLQPYWNWEFCCFHGPGWWREHWEKTGKVRVDHADTIDDGWKDWLRFDEATQPLLRGWRQAAAANGASMLRADRGQNLGFTRVAATKPHALGPSRPARR